MTVNKNSSVGITEDIITNIMHLGASEYHLEILIRKYEDQIKFWYNIDTVSYTHLDVYKRQVGTTFRQAYCECISKLST